MNGDEPAVTARLRAAGCVFAEEEARLLVRAAGTHPGSAAALAAMTDRRARGEPLEHVLGWAEFHGLRVRVEPGVFVPRRRSEFLVRQAAARLRPGAVVLDLCCGSGAVGAAVAGLRPGVELHAADIDPAAVRCARRNTAALGGRVHLGDLYAPLPRTLLGRVDLLLANAPYVPTDAIPLLPAEARDHEPRAALDGGPDGVALHRRVATGAGRWLAPGGWLLIETSARQAPLTAAAVAAAGLTPEVAHDADLEATVVAGTAAGAVGGTADGPPDGRTG